MEREYEVGDEVQKLKGDYTFKGLVVAKFAKRSGVLRYVIEDDRGILMIMNGAQLQPVTA